MDADHRIYTAAWCERQQSRALENYDLNMAFFSRLDVAAFESAVNEVVASHPGLIEVFDLNDWVDVTGVYVMVLDDFKQIYVGMTRAKGGIRDRIRKHWSTSKQFDRLIYGDVYTSVISVDSFRGLDTTRIFAMKSNKPETTEAKIVASVPSQYLLNRTGGGTHNIPGFLGNLVFPDGFTRSLRS
jgi:hypothetical protein